MVGQSLFPGADLGGGCRGCAPLPEMTCGFLIQLVFCKKKKRTMWFIGVELEQETSAPPPKKNPGSAPDFLRLAERMKGKLKKDQASHPSEECQGSCG